MINPADPGAQCDGAFDSGDAHLYENSAAKPKAAKKVVEVTDNKETEETKQEEPKTEEPQATSAKEPEAVTENEKGDEKEEENEGHVEEQEIEAAAGAGELPAHASVIAAEQFSVVPPEMVPDKLGGWNQPDEGERMPSDDLEPKFAEAALRQNEEAKRRAESSAEQPPKSFSKSSSAFGDFTEEDMETMMKKGPEVMATQVVRPTTTRTQRRSQKR